MNVVEKPTKTERRVLNALYRLQTNGYLSSGRLGTYERLMEETIASKAALLCTCQRLTREGKIIREKINARDRKRWARQWPVDYARRQTHFRLSQEMLAGLEAENDLDLGAEEGDSRNFTKRKAVLSQRESNGGYFISEEL
jgi:hypothetical protein